MKYHKEDILPIATYTEQQFVDMIPAPTRKCKICGFRGQDINMRGHWCKCPECGYEDIYERVKRHECIKDIQY